MNIEKTDNEKVWEKVLIEIEALVSKANFITWFQNTNISKTENGIVFLSVPNSFTKEWIKNKYNKFIVGSLRKIDPSIRAIEYIICSTPQNNYPASVLKYKVSPQKIENEQQLGFREFSESSDSLNPRYGFDNFIVGSFNELAHAAALAVTKNPGTVYNPLFIYGGVGLGKTHLLQAIGNEIKKRDEKFKIKYTTSEKFANGIIQSIQNNKTYEFKEEYRKYDLLIVDDIQFLSGKTKTQEEFFHIFNSLYENNKQIIFSSDRAPKSIQDLEARLRSRFEGGMMADVSEPELESRIAILNAKMQLKNINLSKEIVDYIASIIKSNIRELEGALNVLAAQTNLLGKNLSNQELKEIFNKNVIYSKKKITFNKIIKTIIDFYEIEEQFIFEKSRKKEYVLPRQVAMYLLREDFNASYPYIGQKLGGRDHTTVIHAYEKISKDIKNDQRIKDDIQKIRTYLYE
ncbi:chromosomal replication initiator protein DnaA [Patescibacteria group bacterium]